jgi:hypothetical protein
MIVDAPTAGAVLALLGILPFCLSVLIKMLAVGAYPLYTAADHTLFFHAPPLTLTGSSPFLFQMLLLRLEPSVNLAQVYF